MLNRHLIFIMMSIHSLNSFNTQYSIISLNIVHAENYKIAIFCSITDQSILKRCTFLPTIGFDRTCEL